MHVNINNSVRYQQKSSFLAKYQLISNKIIMINPFISNNDSNYLFRKNYQFIAKPQTPSPQPSFSASKLNFLQSRNPFNPPSAAPIVSSPVLPRSLSNSRALVGSSSSRDKLLLGKSRLLDQADGWKRELQSQQRGKLQAYGAQGLRYNPYISYTPLPYENKPYETDRKARNQPNNIQQESKFNDYYESYSKPIQIKPPKNHRESGYNSSFHLKAERNDPPLSHSKKTRQHFSDQINEYDQEPRNLGNVRKQRNKYELDVQPIRQESQRQSKIVDMFGSELMDDRFKQSMQHNSYASYYPDDLVQSKHSKFGKESFKAKNHFMYESDVNRFEALGPSTMKFMGKVYYKIEL